MQKFITVICNGTVPEGTNEIVLFCYGPQGGQRAVERLTPTNAYTLGQELIRAATELEVVA